MNITKKLLIEDKLFNTLFFLITFLPISLLLGSAAINITVVLIDILFLYIYFKKKEFNLKNKLSFYILLIFWFSLLINLIYSLDFENSFLRVIGFVRFAILAFAIQYLIENISKSNKNNFFLIWSIIFFIVSFDLLIEFVLGFNLFGNISPMPGRLSGFLGDELKIGHYYYAFNLLAASSIYYYFKKNTLLYLFLFLSLFVSFVIGERANFIKLFIMIIFFIFLFEKKKYLLKSLLVFFTILFFSIFINYNNTYKERFWTMFGNELFNGQNVLKTINNSPYGGHWNAAWEIFIDNKVFGVGIKNFRKVSGEQKYYNKNILFSETRQSTHPHQLHLEFLSETGIFGFVFFLAMVITSIIVGIKNFIASNSLYCLASVLFLLTSTFLILPAGSFFTTYGACIFWINYGILMAKT